MENLLRVGDFTKTYLVSNVCVSLKNKLNVLTRNTPFIKRNSFLQEKQK